MAGEAETGDICHGPGMGRERPRHRAPWCGKSGQNFCHVVTSRLALHLGGEDGAGPDGGGQDQRVAFLGAIERQGRRRGEAGDSEAHGQFGADRGMATSKGHVFGGEDAGGTLENLGQPGFLHRRRHWGQGDLRKCCLRFCTHGEYVVQSMDRRDPGHKPRVVPECAEMVGRYDLPRAADGQDRRVVSGGCGYIGAQMGRKVRQHAVERTRPDLRAASPAERFRTQSFGHAFCGIPGQCRAGHGGQGVQLLHERPVYSILPAPGPCAAERHAPFVGQRLFRAERDQFQVVSLGAEGLAHAAGQVGLQVVGQDGGGAHGEDACLWAWGLDEMGAIPGGVDMGMRGGTQRVVDGNEAVGQGQAGRGEPGKRASTRRADSEGSGHFPAAPQSDRARRDLGNRVAFDEGDPGGPHPVQELSPRAFAKPLQGGACLYHRDAAPSRKRVVHREGKLHAGNAAADHGHVAGVSV